MGSEMRVLKIGVLVCSAALRGAHWQALKVALRRLCLHASLVRYAPLFGRNASRVVYASLALYASLLRYAALVLNASLLLCAALVTMQRPMPVSVVNAERVERCGVASTHERGKDNKQEQKERDRA